MSALESKITISAIDHVSGVVKDINKSLQSIKTSVSNLGSAWNNVSNAASDFAGRIRNLALIGIGAGAAVFGLTKHYASYAKELSLTSLRTGIAVNDLQKLQYAASLSGVGVDDLNVSLKFLNRSIAVASTNPTSEQAAAFYSMGISARNANGSLKDANSLILELSSKFAKATDSAKMTATAMALFGRSGTTLIPFLREGPEHIKAFEAELAKLGHVWTPQELQLGQGFEESFIKIKTAVSGVASVIAINLFPVLKPIIDSMTAWIVSNKLWLADNIKQDVILFGNALKLVWQHLKAIKDSIMPVIDAIGGFKNVLAFIAGVYIARIIVSFASLVTSILSLILPILSVAKAFGYFSFVILTSPIALFIGGMVALGFAVYEVIKHWSDLKAFMISIWSIVKPHVEGFLNFVTFGMYGAVKSIYNNWDSIKAYLITTWHSLYQNVSYYFNAMYQAIVRFMAPVLPYLRLVWGAIKGYLASTWNFLYQNAAYYFNAIANDILGVFGTNFAALEAKIGGVITSIKEHIMDFVGYIEAPFKKVFAFFEGMYDKIKKVKNLLTFGGNDETENKKTPNAGFFQNISNGIKNDINTLKSGVLSPLRPLIPNGTQQPRFDLYGKQQNIATPISNNNIGRPQSPAQQPNFELPAQNSHIDINMVIDYEGRPTKVTANSPQNINFSASVGKMV